MTVGSGGACVKATSRSSTATHRRRPARGGLGWAKAPDANACGGVPTIRGLDGKDGGHGANSAFAPPYEESMPGTLLHRGELLGGGGALIGRHPGLVGHAVDRFAALLL